MNTRTGDVVRQIAVIATTVGTLIVNALSQILPLNGQTSGEIANRFTNNYFLPQNYVFGIWSLIYIGLIAYTVYQALPAQRENPRLRAAGWWYVLTGFANSIWLVLFHYEQFWLSTVAMAVLLVGLVVIYRALRRERAVPRAEQIAVRIPFSIYLGWITVAAIANVSYALVHGNWDGFGIAYETWGAIMIVVGAVIAGAFAWFNRDLAYAAVIVWAFVGILARFPDVGTIAVSAGLMAAIVGLAGVASTFLPGGRGSGMTATRA
jgi:hypothetical protein